eukprot:COSAG01_NODE_6596_length_3588_cov_1.782459_1_plen_245_part_00
MQPSNAFAALADSTSSGEEEEEGREAGDSSPETPLLPRCDGVVDFSLAYMDSESNGLRRSPGTPRGLSSLSTFPAMRAKVVVLGDLGSGTNSLRRCLYEAFTPASASENVFRKGFSNQFTLWEQVSREPIEFDVWPMPPQEKYHHPLVLDNYLRKAKVVMLVFAINDRKSFDAAAKYLQSLYSGGRDRTHTLVLVGNKVDLEKERQVATSMAESFAAEQVRNAAAATRRQISCERCVHALHYRA